MNQYATSPAQPTRRLSLRRNFIWNFGGVSLYNLSQWVLLLVLARLANPDSVGKFSLMLAISAPIFLTVGMNLRAVQATDAPRRWRLEEYLFLRQILNVVAVIATLIAGFALGLRDWSFGALAVVCIAKSLEAGSQVFYGYFQLRERLDLVTRSLVARAVAGPCLFLLGFWSTHELAVASGGLVLGWGAAQLLLDQRNARALSLEENRPLQSFRSVRRTEVRALARKSAPLGLDQGVASLCTNIPRYLIKYFIGVSHLGIYASQAYLGQVISMITSSMSSVLLPRLSVYYHRGQRKAFIRMLFQLVLFGFAVLTAGLLFAAFFGDAFIRVTLGPAYVNRALLLALMAAAGTSTLQRSLSNGLVASHAFGNYLLVDSLTAAAILGSAIPLIRAYGVVGAAYSTVIGFAVGSVAVIFALLGVIRRMPEPIDST